MSQVSPELLRYFLHLGATGFGGPVALVGYMQRDLVERRRLFSAVEYREGLALAQLAPGPLAAQLAMYLGWARGGATGAALVGVAFVLPSLLMVMAIAAAYVRYGGLAWMQGAFYGIGAAVIAIIARSALKLTALTLGHDRLSWALAAVVAAITAVTESELAWVFLAAGAVSLVLRGGPLLRAGAGAQALGLLPVFWLTGLTGEPAPTATLARLAAYFAEAGAFVFGSGLAIVPFLHAGVVRDFGWLDERQFLDAVAVAMITPGPVVITVAFIGWLVAGPAGALVAALATFLPCYLFTVIPAPHFRRLSRNAAVKAFVDGLTAAATGAIAGAAWVLGRRALVDLPALMLALAVLAVSHRWRRLPEPLLVAGAGVLGVMMMNPPPAAGADAPRTVVFVCEHGSAKSLIAASIFERRARDLGLDLRAVSRGTDPDVAVPERVALALAGDGFDVSGFQPQALGEADVREATRTIAIGVDLGALATRAPTPVTRWDDLPPVSADYAVARDAIAARVDALLRELAPAAASQR